VSAPTASGPGAFATPGNLPRGRAAFEPGAAPLSCNLNPRRSNPTRWGWVSRPNNYLSRPVFSPHDDEPTIPSACRPRRPRPPPAPPLHSRPTQLLEKLGPNKSPKLYFRNRISQAKRISDMALQHDRDLRPEPPERRHQPTPTSKSKMITALAKPCPAAIRDHSLVPQGFRKKVRRRRRIAPPGETATLQRSAILTGTGSSVLGEGNEYSTRRNVIKDGIFFFGTRFDQSSITAKPNHGAFCPPQRTVKPPIEGATGMRALFFSPWVNPLTLRCVVRCRAVPFPTPRGRHQVLWAAQVRSLLISMGLDQPPLLVRIPSAPVCTPGIFFSQVQPNEYYNVTNVPPRAYETIRSSHAADSSRLRPDESAGVRHSK